MNTLFLAYIDPMAGSLVLQTVIAGVIGVAFALRRFGWRFWSLVSFQKLRSRRENECFDSGQ